MHDPLSRVEASSVQPAYLGRLCFSFQLYLNVVESQLQQDSSKGLKKTRNISSILILGTDKLQKLISRFVCSVANFVHLSVMLICIKKDSRCSINCIDT